jgi:hypothetical protein
MKLFLSVNQILPSLRFAFYFQNISNTPDFPSVMSFFQSFDRINTRFFFNLYSGGWSPIESTRHCGHQWSIVPAPDDYDDGEIGGMIGRGNRVLGENLPQCRFVHHKAHMLPVREPEPPLCETSV